MKRLGLVVLLALFAATSAFAQATPVHKIQLPIDSDASGFTLLGGKWATGVTVPYYVNAQSCVDAAAFYGVALDRARVLTDIETAIANWKTQTAAAIVPVYMGETTAVGLADDGQNTASCTIDASPNGFIGQSSGSWYLDALGNMVDADVLFWYGTYPQYPFVTRDVACGACLYLLDTGTHEFGHFWGLGHSADPLATMYYATSVGSTQEETLYTDDIQGIETLYPVAPPPSTPPPPSCASGDTITQTMKNGDVSTFEATLAAKGYVLVSAVHKKASTTVTMTCP